MSGDRMHALVTDGRGGVRLAARPRPAAGPRTALVRVRAASLNRGELRVVAARSDVVPGWDVAGELLSDVPERAMHAGERVVGLVTEGAWAQVAAVPVANLARIPDEVSFEDAATLPVAGLTALQTLRIGGFLLGRRVLVTGGAGGVGRFAIQLAAASGADVVAVVRDGARAAGLTALGASTVVTDIGELERSFDLILESAGGESLTAALGLLVPGGDLVSFGSSSSAPGSLDPRALFNGAPGARLHSYLVFETGPAGPDLALLLRLVRDGRLDTQIDRIVEWEQAADTLAALAERRISGKAVLRVT